MANEWDKRPNESDEEYTWFVAYLHLGPLRTVVACVTALHNDTKIVSKNGKVQNRHKRIEEASIRFAWKQRAGAYDVHMLTAELQTSGAIVVAGIREYAKYFLKELQEVRVHPRTFAELISGVQTLSQLFPPEVIAALLSSITVEQQDDSGKPEVPEIPSKV